MSEQLLLNLPHKKLDGFIPSHANSAALEAIERFDKVFVYGSEKSGKSSMAQQVSEQLGAKILCSDAEIEAFLEDAAHQDAVCDNVEKLKNETALFHLFNLQKSAERKLVLFSGSSFGALPFALPDLKSRLQTLHQVEIDGPDDALVSALFVKYFLERGVQASPALIDYLSKRVERDYVAIYDIVQHLDNAAAKGKTKVSTQLAKRILEDEHE